MTSMLAGMGGTVYAKDLTEVKAAYYKVMDAKVKQYGILTEDDIYYNSGIGFAELVDFDNNGTPELYVIYADGDQNYVQEVWTYSNGQAKRIFQRSTYGYGRVNDEGVSLLKTASNQTYLSIN